MSKHKVTMFCGHQDLGHNPAQRFCNRKCAGFHLKRSKNPKQTASMRAKSIKPYLSSLSPLWDEASTYRTTSGYIKLCVRDTESGYVHSRFQHIVIWERAHGMRVPRNHCLHHLNEIPDDNRLENLLCILVRLHVELHARLRKLTMIGLPAIQYSIERYKIVQEFVRKAQEIFARQERWRGLYSQQVGGVL